MNLQHLAVYQFIYALFWVAARSAGITPARDIDKSHAIMLVLALATLALIGSPIFFGAAVGRDLSVDLIPSIIKRRKALRNEAS